MPEKINIPVTYIRQMLEVRLSQLLYSELADAFNVMIPNHDARIVSEVDEDGDKALYLQVENIDNAFIAQLLYLVKLS